MTINGLDGAIRCPVCRQVPAMLMEEFNGHDRVELRCHMYVAGGETLDMAVSHWNRFVRFMMLETATACALNPGSLLTSPCFNCKGDTDSFTINGVVECADCRLPKYQVA